MSNLVRHAGDVFRFTKPTGFAKNPPLFERPTLIWTAGLHGKPSLNADIQNTAEATRMLADPHFEVLGTNATSALTTYNAEGGITITTAGADSDFNVILPHLDANQSPWTKWTWGTDREVEWMCRIETGASIANAVIWAGLKLTNTSVTATDANQVFFRYEDDVNSGKWQAVYSVAGTDYAIDTGITAAVNTQMSCHIKIDADRVAYMTITDGTTTATVKTLVLTDAIDLIPYIGVEADGAAAAKALNVYGQAISRAEGA